MRDPTSGNILIMRLTKLNFILILTFLFAGSYIFSQDTIIYNVINDLAKDSVIKVDMIIDYVNIFQYQSEVSNDSVDKRIPDPPQPGVIYFNRNDFVDLNHKGLISARDIDFMCNQVENSHKMMLDSNRLNQKTLDYRELSGIVKDCGYRSDCLYKVLLQEYNCRSYASFTNVIYSFDGTRCIIGATQYFQFNKKGVIYLLEHTENSWKIFKVLSNQIF